MSREIKFRAWNTSSNKWVSGLKMTLDGRLKDIDFDDEGRYEFEPRLEQYIIEQYTGLTDKNGKEIYEGDIVEIDKYGKFQIIWNEWACKFDFDKIGKREREEPLLSQDWEQKTEVIGNIHEPPKDFRPEHLKRMGVSISKGGRE